VTTDQEMKSVIEGLLFVVGDEGLEAKQAADVLQTDVKYVIKLMEEMKLTYLEENRGIEIMEVAGSYQFVTRSKHAEYYQRLLESPTTATLSQAALETLAIIAYKQPVTRAEVEEIRGVKTEKPIQTLVSKRLVQEVGRAEGTGRAILYGTTKEFLEYFGLKNIKELPSLPEQINEDSVEVEADLFFEKFQEQFNES
jgi:segregation and condensation protein B